jgi:nickel/cobalt transporter (NicO) family protein
MAQLIAGSFLLSLIHAAIPNHWLPLVLLGRSEGWNKKETLWIAGIAGFAHTLSTVGLGVVIGLIGVELASKYEVFTQVVAPLILMCMGLIYFGLDFKHTHADFTATEAIEKKSKWTIVLSICVAMFFSPCLEIESFYLSAGSFGWKGIIAISLIYLVVTITGIMTLVVLGGRSLEKINWHLLEHHEKKITGFTLILLGIVSFFMNKT